MKKFLLFSFIFVVPLQAAYTSQIGQDRFLNERFFKNKRDGLFIDIGANDGIKHSNSYFFEKELGWSGICFEPLPWAFAKLEQNRGCICINACVAKNPGVVDFIAVKGAPEQLSGMVKTYDPRHLRRLKFELVRDGGTYSISKINAVSLNAIAAQHGIDHVDFLSVDTEGSELIILKSIDYEKMTIDAIAVENNYKTDKIRPFLESKGFKQVTVLCNQDEIYIHERCLDQFEAL